MTPIRFLILCLPLLMAPVVAGAAEKKAPAAQGPKIDPKAVRVITLDQATSDCIGDPKTPLCAVETVMACMLRRDQTLCSLVGKPNVTFGPPWGPDEKVEMPYRVLSQLRVRKRDIPADLRDADWLKPGYVEILILEPNAETGSYNMGLMTHFVARPTPGGWKVVTWAVAGAD